MENTLTQPYRRSNTWGRITMQCVWLALVEMACYKAREVAPDLQLVVRDAKYIFLLCAPVSLFTQFWYLGKGDSNKAAQVYGIWMGMTVAAFLIIGSLPH